MHFKRVSYHIDPTNETIALGRKKVRVREWEDGCVEIYYNGRALACTVFDDKQTHVDPGEVVENKRLGGVLAAIQLEQGRRDEARLALPRVTIRQKDRIRASQPSPAVPLPFRMKSAGAADLPRMPPHRPHESSWRASTLT